MFYQDRTHPDVPELAVKNVNLTAAPPASTGAPQPFDVSAGDGPIQLKAKGSIQFDELLIGIDNIALDVHFDPAASQTDLPQPLADWAKRLHVAGALALHGKGRVPCHSPQFSTFDGTVELSNASASWPGSAWPIEKAHIKLLCNSAATPVTQSAAACPEPPGLHVRLAAADAFCRGVGMHLDSGDFIQDHAAAWKLTQLAGHIAGVARGPAGFFSRPARHQSRRRSASPRQD